MAVKPEKEDNPFNKQVEGYYKPTFKSKGEEEHIAVPLQNPVKRNAETPQEEKKEVEDKWAEKSNKVLKETGSTKRVIDPGEGQEVYSKTWHNVLIVLLVLAIVGGIAGYTYQDWNGNHKVSVSNNNTCEKQICNASAICGANQCNPVTNLSVNPTLSLSSADLDSICFRWLNNTTAGNSSA